MLAAFSLEAWILPAAIRSADKEPDCMLEALIFTAFTCIAVKVPVYIPVLPI